MNKLNVIIHCKSCNYHKTVNQHQLAEIVNQLNVLMCTYCKKQNTAEILITFDSYPDTHFTVPTIKDWVSQLNKDKVHLLIV